MELSAWSSYGLLSLLSFVANLVLGTVILAVDPRRTLNRLYALGTFCIALWALMKVGVATSATVESATLYYRLSAIGWCFLPAVYVHFGSVFTENDRSRGRRIAFVALYVLALLFTLGLWVPGLMLVEMVEVWWGMTDHPGWAFRVLFLPYFLGCFAFVVYDLWRFTRHFDAGEQRARAQLVLGGLLVPLTGGAVTNLLLPALDIYVFELAVPLTTLNAAIVAWAMYRYRFLSLTVEFAASGIIHTMADSLIVCDPAGQIQLVNPATRELLGFRDTEILGRDIRTLLRDEEVVRLFSREASSPIRVQRDADYLDREGCPVAVRLSISTLQDRKGTVVGYVCVGKDIRELKRLIAETEAAKAEVEQLAITDDLTGLHNRRYLSLKMREEWLRSQRFQHPFSIVVVDLDRFKEVNDGFGHDEGDRVLRLVAGALPEAVRTIDTVARFGGDEFVVLLPETPREQALEVAGRIRDSLTDDDLLPADYRFVTATLGVSTYDPADPAPDENDLFRLADWALLQAKRAGRNRVLHAADVPPEDADGR